MLVSLVALSAASLVATFRAELLDWSPSLLEPHRDPSLALTVLAVAVAVGLVLAVVGSLRRRHVLRWLPGLLVPATMAVLFWLAAPPSRLLVLYVATLGLALRAIDEAADED